MRADRNHPKVIARIDRQQAAFSRWLANQDLGPLEDVRGYVEMHSLQNACDAEPNQIFNVARATTQGYLDDESAAEVFNYYR